MMAKIAEIDTPKGLKLRHGQRGVDVEYMDNNLMEKDSFNLDKLGEDEKFLDIIKNKEIITIHSKETTLDDIFIRVTGVENHE